MRIHTGLLFYSGSSNMSSWQYASKVAKSQALRRLKPLPDRPVMASASTTASKVPRLPAPPPVSASVYCLLPSSCSSWRTYGACARG